VDDLSEVISKFDGTVQTLGLAVKSAEREEKFARAAGHNGVDRVVKMGRMHLFSSPWDGVDLIRRWFVSFAMCLHRNETSEVSNGACGTISGGPRSESQALAAGARATFEANKELCSWLLNPLARWAEAAYGEKVFDDAACGYARYCFGVAQAQKVYERAGRYTPEGMPEIMSGVYEDEGYAVPYMWAAILIYALWRL